MDAWVWAPHAEHHPALRQDHPEYVVQGLLRGRILRPQRPRHRGPRRPRRRRPERPPQANPGNTTTSATAGAHTASSSSALAGWPAPVAISTRRKGPPRPSCSKPRTTGSACAPRSHSPTRNAPLSTMATPPSTPSSTDSRTSRPRQDRHHTRSEPGPPQRCCHHPSSPGKIAALDKLLNSTESPRWLDLHSRRLLASATSDHPDADLACDGIKMAVAVGGGRAALTGCLPHRSRIYLHGRGFHHAVPKLGCRSRWAGSVHVFR